MSKEFVIEIYCDSRNEYQELYHIKNFKLIHHFQKLYIKPLCQKSIYLKKIFFFLIKNGSISDKGSFSTIFSSSTFFSLTFFDGV